MQTTNVRFLQSKDCPYTLGGKNLFEFRRAKLRLLAKRLELPADGSHNDLLSLVIARLNQLEAPAELQDLKKFKHRDESNI